MLPALGAGDDPSVLVRFGEHLQVHGGLPGCRRFRPGSTAGLKGGPLCGDGRCLI